MGVNLTFEESIAHGKKVDSASAYATAVRRYSPSLSKMGICVLMPGVLPPGEL